MINDQCDSHSEYLFRSCLAVNETKHFGSTHASQLKGFSPVNG